MEIQIETKLNHCILIVTIFKTKEISFFMNSGDFNFQNVIVGY